MDLICPHCMKRVSVGDDKAGQATNCPLCTKPFTAPSLAPPTPAPPPPPPPPVPPPSITPPTTPSAPAPISSMLPTTSTEPAAPPPPIPPGDYTHVATARLRAEWLVFVAPVCITLILLVLSFFNWGAGRSLWGHAFSEWEWQLTAYTIFLILAFLLTIAFTALDRIPTPAALAPIITWKNLPLGLFLLLAFLFLLIDWMRGNYETGSTRVALTAEAITLRLHLLAVVASFGMFWLHWRKRRNLPPPKLEMHW